MSTDEEWAIAFEVNGRRWHQLAEERRAEIDKLRARVAELEHATEWGAKWSDGGYCPANPARDEEFARRHARMHGTKPIRRHVGPWVYADTGEAVFGE